MALTVWLPILIGHAVDLSLILKDDSLMACLIKMVLVIVANTLIQWINSLYNQLVYRFSQPGK